MSQGSRQFSLLLKVWPWLKRSQSLLILSCIMIPLTAIFETYAPLAVQKAIDLGVVNKDPSLIYKYAGLYFLMIILSYGTRVCQSITTATAVHRMIFDLRHDLIGHILRLPSRFHDKNLSGALATRATGDFENLSESLNQGVLSSIVDVIALVGSIIGMFILSVKLALLGILVIPVVVVIVLWFSKKLNAAMLSARKKIATLNGFTQEALANALAIKLLNACGQIAKRHEHLNREHRDAQMESVFYDAFMFATLDGLSSITLGLLLYFVLKSAGQEQLATPGVLVGFIHFMQQIFEPLKQLGTKMALLQGALTSIDRIFGILDRKEKIAGTVIAKLTTPPTVKFQQVEYRYSSELPVVLKGVSFEVPAGSSVALVGATGSGKSSIIKLLTKMYDGYSGKISIGDFNCAELDGPSLRRQMAIVQQDIVLFDGTIAFNIGLGDPAVTMEDMQRAAKVTQADQFINKLEGGFDFKVQEGGANLSHGQRQLIVFTRALVKDPKIVILDEATSSIDPQTEKLVQEALKEMCKGRTVIIVAHRLNTIKDCSQCIVLEHGHIIESGSIPELLNQHGKFFELWHAGSTNLEIKTIN
jgi:ATP-binding cassette, subfamily B, multidrug efflux pump